MIGSRLGPWIIDEELGRGGMGTVYRARRAADEAPGPAVAAVKVLAGELAVETGFQQRFQREIEILHRLDHPGIVRFYDSGKQDGRFWYAMEYVNGPSFESLRDERGRLPWADVLEMALQLAPALKHAHDRGVIHRDIKPANILRAWPPGSSEASPIVKLTDFGIASLFASPHLTVTGGIIGTPEYLSPEQASGKPVTKKSDLYSLGVVLYTLITGNTPFQGDPVDLLHKHRYGQVEQPSRIVTELPPDFEQIVSDLLEKDPSARPGDAGVLFRRLDSLRRKLQRKEAGETDDRVNSDKTAAEVGAGREGPATFVSRVVRQELERRKRGGPIQRFFNHPVVIVVLFVVCVATLATAFWPEGPESLYSRGAKLMASDSFEDREKAWDRYLGPLEQRYPDHAHKEEVAEMKKRYDEAVTARRAGRRRDAIGEAQWFYERGLRLSRAGDAKGAEKLWRATAEGFAGVPAEAMWVARAEEQLRKGAERRDYAGLRAAVEAAKKAGNEDRAKAALRELYAGDETALKVIAGE